MAQPERSVVLEARGVCKSFRYPDQRLDTLKERLLRPTARRPHESFLALDRISFDVCDGEFFGIVGRNGSGKSSLLKIIASIYRPDQGTVRVAGTLAPFIELGVGFNPELSARENVQLNGVLLGLSRREALERLGEILNFAGLERFAEMKIKNFSSGMLVRLAFSITAQADADILLIDEVLAVGDAAFVEKCLEVFEQRRAAGTTIVLVTHDMSAVRALCDRAMLLEGGRVIHVGNPEEISSEYSRLNDETEEVAGAGSASSAGVEVKLVEQVEVHRVSIEQSAVQEEAMRSLGPSPDTSVEVSVSLRVVRDLARPRVRLQIRASNGEVVTSIDLASPGPAGSSSIIELAGAVDNRLVAGKYFLDCWVCDDRSERLMALQALRLGTFEVSGEKSTDGYVLPRHTLRSWVAPS